MSKIFRAYRVHQTAGKISGRVEEMSWDELSPGEVIIESHFSSVNYKDALAGTGEGKILRQYPLAGGIDVAGVVASTKTGELQVGDKVLVTGCGLSETLNGGYAEYVSVPAASVIRLPAGLSLEESMILGTAGFTAALCLYRLEENGQSPQKGPIVVTGASGGVGTLAIDILAKQGYEVWAVSSKTAEHAFLNELGARKVLTPAQLELGKNPLESVRFAGAIDNVGGDLLAGLLRHIDLWGNVASVGLTSGANLSTTVMPFILRGVSLVGISSNNCPRPIRQEIWRRLAGVWKPQNLRKIHKKTVNLEDLNTTFRQVLDRHVVGRILVNVKKG